MSDDTLRLLDEALLTLDELCRAAPVAPGWVVERIEAGFVRPAGGGRGDWRFDAVALRRVRRMALLEREFDAVPELAALVADLEDEIARLRRRIR
ncbi:chaperone modulator CbpM [Rubrivivax sp. JA1026]|uniref:chaperone modulator CbpM n=1 Tax=Rubrivivax sp. JA1026 TaxID=2710888 RepID=UPI0013E94B93|nr:chaperone modulator CbpM [Rubrivivax sp. JA1026]